MILNNLGVITQQEWLNTEQIRHNVRLGEYIIMPNHMHGIIIIHSTGVLNMCMGVFDTPIAQSTDCDDFLDGEYNSPLLRGRQIISGQSFGDTNLLLSNGLDKIPTYMMYGNAIIMNILSVMANHLTTSPNISKTIH